MAPAESHGTSNIAIKKSNNHTHIKKILIQSALQLKSKSEGSTTNWSKHSQTASRGSTEKKKKNNGESAHEPKKKPAKLKTAEKGHGLWP